MHDTFTAGLHARSRSVLRNSAARQIASRGHAARDYLGRLFPAFEPDPFATRRDRRESLFEVCAPARS